MCSVFFGFFFFSDNQQSMSLKSRLKLILKNAKKKKHIFGTSSNEHSSVHLSGKVGPVSERGFSKLEKSYQ